MAEISCTVVRSLPVSKEDRDGGFWDEALCLTDLAP
jgi:hypothetical protein